MKAIRTIVVGLLIVLDEAIAVVRFQANGHITVSAICGEQYVQRKPCLFCRCVCQVIQRVLGRFWPNLKTHCHNSYVAELPVIDDKELT